MCVALASCLRRTCLGEVLANEKRSLLTGQFADDGWLTRRNISQRAFVFDGGFAFPTFILRERNLLYMIIIMHEQSKFKQVVVNLVLTSGS